MEEFESLEFLKGKKFQCEVIYSNFCNGINVYKILMLKTNLVCILKSTRIDYDYRENNIQREYMIAHTLCNVCKYIPQIYDYKKLQTKDGTKNIFITMEFGGPSLEDTDIVLCQFSQITLQLCDALCFLHDSGVAHLDLKLANILWDGKIIKLIDFGISKAHFLHPWKLHVPIPDDGEGISGFSRYYAPPEVLQYKDQISTKIILGKIDVFCFGMTFIILLTSIHKFKINLTRESNIESHRQFLQKVAAYLEEIKENRFKKFLLSCLDYDPMQRPNFHQIKVQLKKIFKQNLRIESDTKKNKFYHRELAILYQKHFSYEATIRHYEKYCVINRPCNEEKYRIMQILGSLYRKLGDIKKAENLSSQFYSFCKTRPYICNINIENAEEILHNLNNKVVFFKILKKIKRNSKLQGYPLIVMYHAMAYFCYKKKYWTEGDHFASKVLKYSAKQEIYYYANVFMRNCNMALLLCFSRLKADLVISQLKKFWKSIKKTSFCLDLFNELTYYRSMAQIYSQKGDFPRAKKYLIKEKNIAVRILSDKNYYILQIQMELAEVHMKLEEYEKALNLYLAADTFLSDFHGIYPEIKFKIYTKLAILFANIKEWSHSRFCLKNADKIVVSNSENRFLIPYLLGYSYYLSGKHELLQEVEKIQLSYFPRQHQTFGLIYQTFGQYYHQKGLPKQAIEYFLLALRTEGNLENAGINCNIADSYMEENNSQKAIFHYNISIQNSIKLYGLYQENIASKFLLLARAFLVLHNFDACTKCINISKAIAANIHQNMILFCLEEICFRIIFIIMYAD